MERSHFMGFTHPLLWGFCSALAVAAKELQPWDGGAISAMLSAASAPPVAPLSQEAPMAAEADVTIKWKVEDKT